MWYFNLRSILAFRPAGNATHCQRQQPIPNDPVASNHDNYWIRITTLACQPPLRVPASMVGLTSVQIARHFWKWQLFLLCRNSKINISKGTFGIVGSLELGSVFFLPHQQKWASELSFLAALWGTEASTWQPYNHERKKGGMFVWILVVHSAHTWQLICAW